MKIYLTTKDNTLKIYENVEDFNVYKNEYIIRVGEQYTTTERVFHIPMINVTQLEIIRFE